MNVLATVIACYGLFEKRPAAPQGADDPSQPEFYESMRPYSFGLVHSEFPPTQDIYTRAASDLMDLMIAVGGRWGAGACVARGKSRLGLGALLLAFTNIVGIRVAGSIVM